MASPAIAPVERAEALEDGWEGGRGDEEDEEEGGGDGVEDEVSLRVCWKRASTAGDDHTEGYL